MKIHTVSPGESLYGIAAKYSIPITKLMEDNDIFDDRPIPGEELLILTPTKTKTVAGGDTLDGLAQRYRVRKSTLLANNPSLKGNERLRPGRIITIKQDTPILGAGTAMAEIDKESTRDDLTRVLAYVTYLRINAAIISEDGSIRTEYDGEWAADACNAAKKVPLLGVHDLGSGEFLIKKEGFDGILDGLVETAAIGGYRGIAFSAREGAEKHPEAFCEFIMAARKRFIGCDLILFTDIYDTTPLVASELSDGGILMVGCEEYGRLRQRLSEFAANAESSKVLIHMIPCAKIGDKFISINEAKELCHRRGGSIRTDEKTLLSDFQYTRYRTGKGEILHVSFPSQRYTKAKLELISELGFMGISFDSGKTPAYILSMFNALFARADHTLP